MAEAMLEMRNYLDVMHPLVQQHLEGLREEFEFAHDDYNDQEVWDHALDMKMFSQSGIKVGCISWWTASSCFVKHPVLHHTGE